MKSSLKSLAIFGGIAIIALIIIGNVISVHNQEVEVRNLFTQKMDERKAFYDKLYKVLAQKSQIALKNDTSFRKNIEIVMAGRKDAQGVVMKWITESNPNAQYSEVSALFKDLSRAVEAQREGFFDEEKQIQDIVRTHNNLLQKFPSGFILTTFMGAKPLVYAPISSSRTDEVFKTGKDDNVDLF
jgi:hypothetical protein